MKLLKPDPLPENATLNQITLWLFPDDDRVTKSELRKCLYKIKLTLMDACTANQLKCEGVIDGWNHSFLEQNPYPMSKPGFQNKFPEPSWEDFHSEDWLLISNRLRTERRDTKGREYGHVYYTNDDITINANEFKTWYLNKGGKGLIDDLFLEPLKPVPWWENYKLSNNDRRNRIAKEWRPTVNPEVFAKMNNQQILDALAEYSGDRQLFLDNSGGKDWLYRDHSVIPRTENRQ